MKRSVFLLALVFFTVTAVPMLAQDNPFLGTWKLNTAKSKFEGAPAPQTLTRTVVAQGNGVKYSFEGVAATGNPLPIALLLTMTKLRPRSRGPAHLPERMASF